MSLSDDEYTCLLIMKDGENLIRMRDTRWYAPLGSLYERDLIKPIGNENFVITQKGTHALIEHEDGETGLVRQMINKQGELTAGQKAIHSKMWEAINALVAAAQTGAKITGGAPVAELEKIGREVLTRALAQVQQ